MDSTLTPDGQGPAPCPERFNLTRHTLAGGAAMPDKPALIFTDGTCSTSWSHGEIASRVSTAARGLRAAGLMPGGRMMLRLGNGPAFPILFFAAAGIGAIPVPVSAQLTDREIAGMIHDLAPVAVAVGDGLSAPLHAGVMHFDATDIARLIEPASAPDFPWADTHRDDPAYIVFTSGTGSAPKGVVHAHRAGWARRMMWRDWYGLRATDRVLHAGAFNWTYTLGTGLTDPWAVGATAIIYTGPQDPSVWSALIEEQDASIFAAAPGVYRQVLRNGTLRHGTALRHGLSAGEALPEPVRSAWEAATGTPIYQALGMSEISTYVSENPHTGYIKGGAGWAQAGRNIAILPPSGIDPLGPGSVGMLAVHRDDPGLMLRYWNRPEDTRAAFRGAWFVTGDLAEIDAQGLVRYHGRADDLMTSLGYRVAPQEVEEVLLAHPSVRDCAVTEVSPRPDLSLIAAFVVAEGTDKETLAAHCAEHLARYKCPKLWKFTEQLPRGATGKINRRRLRETWPKEAP